ncbi:MAG TPA: hypothetical protein VMY43_09170 [Methanothrix sp.]|nr:hypothetical protein [Methanothrix sp.]
MSPKTPCALIVPLGLDPRPSFRSSLPRESPRVRANRKLPACKKAKTLN